MRVLPEKTALVIPTLNAAAHLDELVPAIKAQKFQPARWVVVDSGSTDGTPDALAEAGAEMILIDKKDFDHGGTRQMVVDHLLNVEIVLFMTQDAVPADEEAFGRLVSVFDNDRVGAAYGRQIPHLDAGPIGSHARIFNYPDESHMLTRDDIAVHGFKATMMSNSFSAYRRTALSAVGGFPSGTIFGEDALVAAKMLLSGWTKYYVADATVRHSHDYSLAEEFRRYFDVGVFHNREAWMRERFGTAEGEGMRFVLSELRYLLGHGAYLVPSAVVRTGLKYLAYRLGLMEGRLPLALKTWLSMHKGFWRRQAQSHGP